MDAGGSSDSNAAVADNENSIAHLLHAKLKKCEQMRIEKNNHQELKLQQEEAACVQEEQKQAEMKNKQKQEEEIAKLAEMK